MNKVQIINQGKNYTHASAGNISAFDGKSFSRIAPEPRHVRSHSAPFPTQQKCHSSTAIAETKRTI